MIIFEKVKSSFKGILDYFKNNRLNKLESKAALHASEVQRFTKTLESLKDRVETFETTVNKISEEVVSLREVIELQTELIYSFTKK